MAQRHRLDWQLIHDRRRAQYALSTALREMYPTDARPSEFGMTREQLRTEIARCREAGWQNWEIRCVLVRPHQVPRKGWVA